MVRYYYPAFPGIGRCIRCMNSDFQEYICHSIAEEPIIMRKYNIHITKCGEYITKHRFIPTSENS